MGFIWNLIAITDCGSYRVLFFFSLFLPFSLGLFSFLSASLFLLSTLDFFLVMIKTYVQYKCCSSCDRDTGNTYITYTVHYIYIYIPTIVLWVQKRKKSSRKPSSYVHVPAARYRSRLHDTHCSCHSENCIYSFREGQHLLSYTHIALVNTHAWVYVYGDAISRPM